MNWRSKINANSNDVTLLEGLGKFDTAVTVVNITPAVITVNPQGRTLPTWQTPGWIWWCDKSNGNAGVNSAALRIWVVTCSDAHDAKLEIDRLGSASNHGRMMLGCEDWEVRQQNGVFHRTKCADVSFTQGRLVVCDVRSLGRKSDAQIACSDAFKMLR
jgi:hypothetical protein